MATDDTDILDRVKSAVLRMDTEGRVTYFNAFAQSFFGFSEEEIVGRNVVGTIVPPTDSAGRDLRAMIRDMGSRPELYEANENQNLRKDGTPVWVAWSNAPICDAEGRVKEILCVGNDITPRIKAEESLRRLADLQSLIARISSSFLGLPPNEIDSGMVGALEAVGRFLGANRGLVIEFEPGSYNVACFYQWHAPDASAFEEDLIGMPIDQRFPWFMEAIARGDVVSVPDVLELPEEAAAERELLSSVDVRSLLALPLRSGGDTMGCFVLEHVKTPITWPQESMALMRILGAAVTDALARKRAERELRASEERFRSLVQNAEVGVYRRTVGPDARFLEANPAMARMFGYDSVDELLNTPVADVYPDQEDRHRFIYRLAREGYLNDEEQRLLRRDGTHIWISVSARAHHGASGDVEWLDGVMIDVSARRAAYEKLRRVAVRDALTGLHNRAHFQEELAKEVRSASRYQYALSLCVCDLDGFKGVNDTFGHATGDNVLSAFARLLGEAVRDSDVAARFGGDEFCIAFPHTPAAEAAGAVERLRRRLETTTFQSDDGREFNVTATFGFADLAPGMEADGLFEAADGALYDAKRAGRNQICVRAADGQSSLLE